MLVGDPAMRSRPDTSLKRQNCYRCYTGPNFGGDVSAPCQDARSATSTQRPSFVDSQLTQSYRIDTEALPKAACPGGIRSNILFPT